MSSGPVSSRAPGKVIVNGEYAVLEGYPALVQAVDRYVECELSPASGSGVCVEAPGLLDEAVTLHWRDADRLVTPDSRLHFLVAALNALLYSSHRRQALLDAGWTLKLDSRALFDRGDKLGLGSSAALVVALDSLLQQAFDSEPEPTSARWQRLHAVHSEAQGKRGSGTDIAASMSGGCSVFTPQGKSASIVPFAWPDALHCAYIWTGQSASTTRFLGSFSQWRQDSPKQSALMMTALGQASAEVCQNHGATELREALEVFTTQLWALDQSSRLGIFTELHTHLFEAAARVPALAYKPCGAGGGDLGLAVSEDAAALAQFIRRLPALGARAISLSRT